MSRNAFVKGVVVLGLFLYFSALKFFASERQQLCGVLFITGLAVGSFMNVLVWRLPKILHATWTRDCAEFMGTPLPIDSNPIGLTQPASHCPHCKTKILAWQNIPVISYLLLKGRCAHCAHRISMRYPLVELAVGLLFASLVGVQGSNGLLIAHIWFFSVLLALSLIDADTQLLPDILTLPLLWSGLIVNWFELIVPLKQAVLGAIVGYGLMWLIATLFRLITKKEGMGGGDFKLVAALGAWLGWMAVPLIVVLGALLSSMIGGGLILTQRTNASAPQPFGPFLIIAACVVWWQGPALTHWYLAQI